MTSNKLICLILLTFSLGAFAQGPPPGPAGGPPGMPGMSRMSGMSGTHGNRGMMMRHEMGEWWRDSKVAKALGLSDSQIADLNKIFYDHRLKLIDDGAAMEKADLKLQTLLDEDVPNQGQVSSQVDQVLAARGSLEREYTMMNLDLRKVLTVDQWKQLKSIRNQNGPGGNMFFYKRLQPGSGPETMPPPPPPAGPGGNEMF